MTAELRCIVCVYVNIRMTGIIRASLKLLSSILCGITLEMKIGFLYTNISNSGGIMLENY